MTILNQNLGRLWSSLIIEELIRRESCHFFISPGQRNAPLIAAITHNPKAQIRLGIDERAQAFRALGFSKSSGKSAVLVCTSGTAVANYLPAVIEAKKSHSPLFILSADRPWEMVWADANQTIEQDLFGKFLNAYLDTGSPTEQVSPAALMTSVANLHFKSQNGPVHLNLPLREPLEAIRTPISEKYLDACEKILKSSPIYSRSVLENPDIGPIAKMINEGKKGLLVVGELPSHESAQGIRNLIKRLKWPFLLDVCSSLKFEHNLLHGAVPSFDHPEVLYFFAENPPESILHLGGRLVSKHYYSFLADHPEIQFIKISPYLEKEDPSHSLDMFIHSDVNRFCENLIPHLYNFSMPRYSWESLASKKIEIIDSGPLTYPQVSKSLMEWLPDGSTLYIGNSTAIKKGSKFYTTGV
jgi:2-succinyl-5-enolpyruvyl-6-hydroxy-3-cyclohexene-1-carboxylate synthase